MKRPIEATGRCNLFEEISKEVWRRFIEAHDVNVDIPEVGITADIIIDILNFSKYQIGNFDVYAKKGWNENIYGSDLEIHIETIPNEYVMYALQAKVLKKNNRYNTLRDSSDGIMQWQKLSLLEGATGCKSYYLLYNGKENFRHSGRDLCNRTFNEEQFGCSLVEPNVIEYFANQKSTNGNFKNPTFEEIHPRFAKPWRVLTCCYSNKEDFELYKLEEILNSNPALNKIEFERSDKSFEEELDQQPEKDKQIQKNTFIPYVQNNRLNNIFRELSWNPDFRIIIKRTYG